MHGHPKALPSLVGELGTDAILRSMPAVTAAEAEGVSGHPPCELRRDRPALKPGPVYEIVAIGGCLCFVVVFRAGVALGASAPPTHGGEASISAARRPRCSQPAGSGE